MKKIFMLGVLVFSMMALSINVNATTILYNDVNSTYTATAKTYTVGTGCSSDTEGVTCYSGDSYEKVLTTNSIGKRNNPMLVFYKGDIIEFVADTAKPSGNKGEAFGLNKGFVIVDGSYNDITSQYAKVITSVVSKDTTVYQKIKITSDLPVQLLFKGSGVTGFETAPNSLNQKWSDRFLHWNIGIYNKSSIPIVYNYDGGEFYGSATPPTSLYVTSTGYTFDLPVVYKEGRIFKGWTASNIISFDGSANQTAKVSGTTTWGSHSSSGLISTRESITLTPLFNYLDKSEATITLNANGGKIDGYSSHIYNTNIDVSPQNDGYLTGFGIENYIPTKSGSTFDGWYLDQALTQKVTKDGDVFYTRLDDSKTLYAKWKAGYTGVTSKVTTKLYGYDDVKVLWNKVSDATSYKVYYKKSTSKSYTYLGTTSKLYMYKSNLTDGAKYYFKVVAIKNGKSSTNYKASAIYTLKKLNTPSITKYSKYYVKARWNNIYGETGYELARSSYKTKNFIIIKRLSSSYSSINVKTTRGKTYYYKVRAYKTVDNKRIYGPWSYVKSYKLY